MIVFYFLSPFIYHLLHFLWHGLVVYFLFATFCLLWSEYLDYWDLSWEKSPEKWKGRGHVCFSSPRFFTIIIDYWMNIVLKKLTKEANIIGINILTYIIYELTNWPDKMYLLMCTQWRLESACAFVQSDQSFSCLHEEPASFVMQNSPSEDSDQTANADLNLCWVHMSKGIFYNDATPLLFLGHPDL